MNAAEKSNKRKAFLKTIAASGVAASVPRIFYATLFYGTALCNNSGDVTHFLFQGDSIMDGSRTRNNDWNHVLGYGYQYIIASKLWYELPKKNSSFYNRDISDNKVTDLAKNQPDFIMTK